MPSLVRMSPAAQWMKDKLQQFLFLKEKAGMFYSSIIQNSEWIHAISMCATRTQQLSSRERPQAGDTLTNCRLFLFQVSAFLLEFMF